MVFGITMRTFYVAMAIKRSVLGACAVKTKLFLAKDFATLGYVSYGITF